MTLKIIDIAEITKPIASPIRFGTPQEFGTF
jgi:hypothetical protein